MTEAEMIAALQRQYDIDGERARAIVRLQAPMRASVERARADMGPSLRDMMPRCGGLVRAYDSGRRLVAMVPVQRGYTAPDLVHATTVDFEEALGIRERGSDALSLTLIATPRTKKTGTTLGIKQKAAYRFYRDCIIAQVEPMKVHLQLPLPDQPYNCRAVYYVDKRGERADYNGLNQGLHDALQNAGVVSDDWHFRTCDGTRIVFGDDRPRVEVHITPIPQGT